MLKNKKKIFALVMAISMTITGCSVLDSMSGKPNENMTIKLNASPTLIERGGVENPWNTISFTTNLLFRNLFIADATDSYVSSDLAQVYTVSSDALTYEITLKDNIFWSDGEAITIEDVDFSIKTLLLANSVNEVFVKTFKGIEGANEFIVNPELGISGITLDDNKLTIKLLTPNYTFTQVLAQFVILPEHILRDENPSKLNESSFWNNPVTSGMYKLGEHVSGEYLEYVYNENYTEQVPYLNSIMLRTDYDYSELTYYDTSDVSKMLEFRSYSNMREHDVINLFYRYFVFNIEKGGEIDPVMSDFRVRQAITYAIDRDALMKNNYFNTGEIINTGIIREYNGPIDVEFPYDPQKAIELLDEANYDFDRPLVLLYYYEDETSIKFMKDAGKYLEAVGFTIEYIADGDLYNSECDNYDIGLKGLPAFSSADWYTEYLSSSSLYKKVFGGEPLFDDLIYDLYATTNIEDRVEVMRQLQELEHSLIYKYPIFTMGHRVYISSDLSIPADVTFGNSNYKYDIHIEDWKFK